MESKVDREDNFTDYLLILWKRRVFVAMATSIVVLLSLVAVGISKVAPAKYNPLPQKYRAIALVQIRDLYDVRASAGRKELAEYEYLAELAGVRTDIKVKNALITLLARSNPVIEELSEKTISGLSVVDSESARSILKKDFRKNIKVEPDELSRTITISYVSIYRGFSSLVVNTLVDILNERMLKVEREDYENRLSEIRGKLESLNLSEFGGEKVATGGSTAPTGGTGYDVVGDYSEIKAKTRSQYEQLLMNLVLLSKPLNIVEAADMNIEFVGESRLKIIIAGLAIGLFVSTFIAFVMEYIDRVRADAEKMRKIKSYLEAGKK